MTILTNFIENIALALKPIGLGLVAVSAFLFIAIILVPDNVTLSFRLLLALGCLWFLTLSAIYLFYCPGAAALLFIKWKPVSLIRRVNTKVQFLINIFVLSMVLLLILATARTTFTLVR